MRRPAPLSLCSAPQPPAPPAAPPWLLTHHRHPPQPIHTHTGAQESPGDALVAAADAALALGREMQGAVVTAQVRRRPLMPDAVRAAAEAAGEQLAALTAETFRGQPTAALGFLTVDVGARNGAGSPGGAGGWSTPNAPWRAALAWAS